MFFFLSWMTDENFNSFSLNLIKISKSTGKFFSNVSSADVIFVQLFCRRFWILSAAVWHTSACLRIYSFLPCCSFLKSWISFPCFLLAGVRYHLVFQHFTANNDCILPSRYWTSCRSFSIYKEITGTYYIVLSTFHLFLPPCVLW